MKELLPSTDFRDLRRTRRSAPVAPVDRSLSTVQKWVQPGLVVLVWGSWALLGGHMAFESLIHDWPVALTMVFGSLVGGGTSEGGGAVAFPVFTKLLMIPPGEARVFTFAIQSIGMSAASIVILTRRFPVEKFTLRRGIPAGILGVFVSSLFVAPLVSGPLVRLMFSAVLAALATGLILSARSRSAGRSQYILARGPREGVIIVGTAFAGGVLSGVVGVGENTLVFAVLVLLFRVSEKVATPTTVLLMTCVSLAAFASHLFIVRDFTSVVQSRWLAAVPIVVIGAPIGARLCARLSDATIGRVLVALVACDCLSTVLLVPIDTRSGVLTAAVLILLIAGFAGLARVKTYDPRSHAAVPKPHLAVHLNCSGAEDPRLDPTRSAGS